METTIDPIAPAIATEDIIALHDEGLSPGEIARKLHTSWDTVYSRLIRAGLKPHPRPLAVPTEDIVTLHKQGLSPTEIADELHTTRAIVYERLREHGFKPHPLPSPLEDIIALHKEGLPPTEIATRLGISYSTVWGRLTRAGITPHPAPPPPAVIPTEDIIALHEQGLPPGEIAKKLGMAYYSVYKRLRGADIKPHPALPLPIPIEDIITLHNEGLSPGEIAARLGVSYSTAWGRLRGAGITPHPSPPPPAVIPIEDIIALHEEALPPTEIAARLGISYNAVYKRLTRAGITPHLALLYVKSAEYIRDIISLHEKGLTPKEIAESLGLYPATVQKRLREAMLAPHPSAAETASTLQAIDEIIRLAKEGVPRYEIAKCIGSTWPLVAEALDKASVKPVWPACEELTTWAETLLPLLDEIKEAHPNSEPILRKVESLEKEMLDISDATWTVEAELASKGKEADKERYCVAEVSQPIKSNLADRISPLKGCVKALDVAELPRKIEQAETCVRNLTSAIGEDIRRMPAAQEAMMMEQPIRYIPKTVAVHSSEAVRVGIGDSVCDKHTGACGPILDIMEEEVLIEPTTRKGVGEEYLEVAEPPIRAKKINLEPDHIRRYEMSKEADTNKEILLDILEHEATGSGLVLNPARAAATPCKGFTYDKETYAWSPGVLGLISSKKNPEQLKQFCALGIEPAGEGAKERFTKIKGAIEEAHREWGRKGEGLASWWSEVAKSLKKHEVEL